MSFCCLPKLSCFSTKSRIRSTDKSEILQKSKIDKSFSVDRFRSFECSSKLILSHIHLKNPDSKQNSFCNSRSLPDISKNLGHSRASHKSIIAVRYSEKFDLIKPILREKKKDEMPSLDMSQISNVNISDNSTVGILKELESAECGLGREGKVGRKRVNQGNFRILQFMNKNKKETPPMFLKNPCFSSGNSTMLKSDGNN